MSDNNLVRSFVAVLYHVGEEVRPVKVITRNDHWLPGYNGRLVTEGGTRSFQVKTLDFSFQVISPYREKMRTYITCATDFAGFKDDILLYDERDYPYLASDFWEKPEDFGKSAQWDLIYTGEEREHAGEIRAVFKLWNVAQAKFVRLVHYSPFTYLQLTASENASHFMFKAVKDVKYR
ncbi:hypothetical protein KW869_17230 [Pseudomonas urmiensis]|jgi:hypothetical protein|uniref:Uncharacterized protein n=1 Tax=Pseudomonas urmiensis TaxID=2745493 RepID=A0ABW8NZD6_9PSED|nr:hypothetical protein [Pseudomonas sp.]